jgi:Transcription factor WhiB
MSILHLRPPGSPGGHFRFSGSVRSSRQKPSHHDEEDDMYAIHPLAPTGFAQPASPTAVRAPAPRCADGNGTLTPLFFSDDLIDIARAKAICRKCALAASCLREALAREEPWGVWGGELLLSGRIVTSKRPCGRPPKHPRPELIVDELGPVGQRASVA